MKCKILLKIQYLKMIKDLIFNKINYCMLSGLGESCGMVELVDTVVLEAMLWGFESLYHNFFKSPGNIMVM